MRSTRPPLSLPRGHASRVHFSLRILLSRQWIVSPRRAKYSAKIVASAVECEAGEPTRQQNLGRPVSTRMSHWCLTCFLLVPTFTIGLLIIFCINHDVGLHINATQCHLIFTRWCFSVFSHKRSGTHTYVVILVIPVCPWTIEISPPGGNVSMATIFKCTSVDHVAEYLRMSSFMTSKAPWTPLGTSTTGVIQMRSFTYSFDYVMTCTVIGRQRVSSNCTSATKSVIGTAHISMSINQSMSQNS